MQEDLNLNHGKQKTSPPRASKNRADAPVKLRFAVAAYPTFAPLLSKQAGGTFPRINGVGVPGPRKDFADGTSNEPSKETVLKFPKVRPMQVNTSAVSGLYEFGPFCLDPVKRVLLRDGAPVPLTPKAFDTLQVLVSGAEQRPAPLQGRPDAGGVAG